VTLPGDGQSFALIYSIEDPTGKSEFTGVGAQVMGPEDGYLLQYSKDVSSFWAARQNLALGATFRSPTPSSSSNQNMAPTPKGIIPEQDFSNSVAEGFQASSTWHQGKIVAAEDGAAGDLKSTVSSCNWAFSVEPKVGWGDEGARQRATAGWLASLPVFEPHWQVLMAHGEASGWIEWGGKKYEFTNAPCYAEKNWGGGFPTRWCWIQCNSFENSPGTSVTAVGARRGLLQLPGVLEDVGLIGIHHQGAFYELNVKDSEIEWDVQPWGQWKITGKNKLFEAVVEATCDMPGTPLRAPTAAQGLAPFCRDSFGGVVRIRVWKAGGQAAGAMPVIDVTSENKSGAVEVGGGPWWSGWQTKAEMSAPVRQLLNLPLDVEALTDWVPPMLRPPGL
jgi:tocopherol cyclase